MNDDKFRVIGETKVGALDETMRAEWDRLYSAQLKLTKLQDAHEEALDAFWEVLHRKFGHHTSFHDVTQHFRVSEDGEVYLAHCKCPVCQADIHGLTVSETVEKMYESDLISDQVIEVVRQRAKAVDSGKKMGKKVLN